MYFHHRHTKWIQHVMLGKDVLLSVTMQMHDRQFFCVFLFLKWPSHWTSGVTERAFCLFYEIMKNLLIVTKLLNNFFKLNDICFSMYLFQVVWILIIFKTSLDVVGFLCLCFCKTFLTSRLLKCLNLFWEQSIVLTSRLRLPH